MLVIHIGFRKTGSSSIQHFLSLNADRLARCGVDYPEAGRIGWAHNGLHQELQAGGDLPQWRAVRDLAAARRDRVTVLSCEGLGNLPSEQIARLGDLLADLDIRVLAYVRDPASWVVSFYNQQTLKGGNALDFDIFFARREALGRLRPADDLAAWAAVFGWEALRVRTLDPASLTGGGLLDDLLDGLGLAWKDIGPHPAGLAPRKVSRGWKPVEVVRALNGAIAGESLEGGYARATAKVRKACLQIVADLGLDAERTLYPTCAQREFCRTLFARQIETLNRLLNDPLPQPAEEEAGERPFLPSILRIPHAERLAMAQRLSAWARDAGAIDRRRAEALSDLLLGSDAAPPA